MTDTNITPLRPADQSCLAHAQPVRSVPPLSVTVTHECTGLRVMAYSHKGRGSVEIEITTTRGRKVEILDGLPREIMGRLVTAFADAGTRRGT